MILTIDIAVEDEAWHKLDPDLEQLCRKAINSVDLPKARAGGELSIALVDDGAIQSLNKSYRGMDKPTNVLSFPVPKIGGGQMLGDIILARETTLAEAAAQGKSPVDHVTHLLIHGFLHLLGHDHKNAEDASLMEALEIKALAKLGIDNPYEIHESRILD